MADLLFYKGAKPFSRGRIVFLTNIAGTIRLQKQTNEEFCFIPHNIEKLTQHES